MVVRVSEGPSEPSLLLLSHSEACSSHHATSPFERQCWNLLVHIWIRHQPATLSNPEPWGLQASTGFGFGLVC